MTALSIPTSHHDLVTGTPVVMLSTLNADNSIQTTAIWINLGGDGILRTSVTIRRQKYRNLVRTPEATLFALSSTDPFHTLEVRAHVDITDDPDRTFLAELIAPYDQPLSRFGTDDRVVLTFHPRRVRTAG